MSTRTLTNTLTNATTGDADDVQADLDDLLAFARADDDAITALDGRLDTQEAKVEATGALAFTTDGSGVYTGDVLHGMGVTPDIVVLMPDNHTRTWGISARDTTKFTVQIATGVAATAFTYRWWARKV